MGEYCLVISSHFGGIQKHYTCAEGFWQAVRTARLSLLWIYCVYQPAFLLPAVDTTGAGDTFTGYFLHLWTASGEAQYALCMAAKAAA
ncbi:MAG: hypothetical protein IJC18_06230, partial [Clostridia bacterium]|nr:hypothetical protein [Clostridia bacterium]